MSLCLNSKHFRSICIPATENRYLINNVNNQAHEPEEVRIVAENRHTHVACKSAHTRTHTHTHCHTHTHTHCHTHTHQICHAAIGGLISEHIKEPTATQLLTT